MSLLNKPCPAIGGLTFIKGDPIQISSTQIHSPLIIEFWASWCGPCRMAFPHLSELARKYKDKGLRVVGVNIEGDTSQVRKMVQDQGSKMDYTVAIDVGQQASMKLMGAAGLSGIPAAFIIDSKGIIRHYGHPMQPQFAQVLDQVCKESSSQQQQQQQSTTKISVKGKSSDDLIHMPVKELKAILSSWNVPFGDLNEKHELVERILEKCAAA